MKAATRTSLGASLLTLGCAAWLCGDGGLWHFGPRDRGHETLLPPVLTADSAAEMADAVRRVAEATGMAVLPENPPSPIYLGDLHILDYFARVAEGSEGPARFRCPDELRARAVYDFAVGHHHHVVYRDHLLRSFVPLYLGRTAAFVLATRARDAEAAEAALDATAAAFEQQKPYLVDRW
mgnify:CR=1 FL=1